MPQPEPQRQRRGIGGGLARRPRDRIYADMEDVDIVIIGAGAAGIAAARRLQPSRLSVLLVEALPRLGGRGWTLLEAGQPLDMGCGYLHSGDINPWTEIAAQSGFVVDRREPAWNRQYRSLGAPAADWAAAEAEFAAWSARLSGAPPASDVAADALTPDGRWNAYLQALSGYISGDELERISAADYAAYEAASTRHNWRLPQGYGALIAGSLPPGTRVALSSPVRAVRLDHVGVVLETPSGALGARAAIFTGSTRALVEQVSWPAALDPWREAAARLPLGDNEKLFFEITGSSPFAPETHVLADLHDPAAASFYLRPLGRPVIECFTGGAGARALAAMPRPERFEHALGQLARLFGGGIRRCLRPLAVSEWARTPSIGGGYSHALPGQAAARAQLRQSFDGRLFFAGEATHATAFSTAHGAYWSGLRAAEEALAALRPGASGAGSSSRAIASVKAPIPGQPVIRPFGLRP